MKILVINAGSSSIKYQVFDGETEHSLVKGIVECIGEPRARIVQEVDDEVTYEIDEPIDDFEFAMTLIKDTLEKDKKCCINDIHEIKAVGHRVVHGGEEFTKSMIIDDNVLHGIERFIELAPLHNPANLAGIKACMALLPGVPNIAVFDTAFHSTMPKRACLYALPYSLYEERKIRKYGFHGTSHRYVAHRTGEMLGKDEKDLKIISCHLGNGASITAVDHGKSVETSMGFTPLEGVIMGTRCGDVDPSVVFYLMEQDRLSIRQIKDVLNKQSGLLGISGVSNDLRSVKAEAEDGNKRADLAIKMYTYRIKKFIGAYVAVMNGVDAIAFTAGVGENNPFIRKIICGNLGYIGVDIDDSVNESRDKEKVISTKDSKVDVLVVPTNEELMIARDTYNIVK